MPPGACLPNARTSTRLALGWSNDLKQRGMLDDTLIIWGGEFGRTIYSQGGLSKKNYGRDHHPRCFTMWMAGGGSRGGQIYGETDDFSYNIAKDPVSHPRLPRDGSAPAGLRSPEVHVQVPGIGSEADGGRTCESDRGIAGLRAVGGPGARNRQRGRYYRLRRSSHFRSSRSFSILSSRLSTLEEDPLEDEGGEKPPDPAFRLARPVHDPFPEVPRPAHQDRDPFRDSYRSVRPVHDLGPAVRPRSPDGGA